MVKCLYTLSLSLNCFFNPSEMGLGAPQPPLGVGGENNEWGESLGWVRIMSRYLSNLL
jgi:hypothetical protein